MLSAGLDKGGMTKRSWGGVGKFSLDGNLSKTQPHLNWELVLGFLSAVGRTEAA